ncbi:MAG: hypothetical protein NVS2B9_17010 [Myxococcales bacterium]
MRPPINPPFRPASRTVMPPSSGTRALEARAPFPLLRDEDEEDGRRVDIFEIAALGEALLLVRRLSGRRPLVPCFFMAIWSSFLGLRPYGGPCLCRT